MAKFIPIDEIIKDLCLREGDLLQRRKGIFKNCSKDVWDDMNEDVLKIAKRVMMPLRCIYPIDKRTNSITLPVNTLRLSSVNVIDECGNFIPVFRNDKVHDDLVDIPAEKNCACEFGCSYQLCNTIKGYEAVQSVKSDYLPDGSPISFNCIDRKYVDAQGFFYSQTQAPLRQYVSGIWTDTILNTENVKMCQVEVDANGCICDTQQNIDAVCNCFDYPDPCTTTTNLSFNPIPIGGDANCPPIQSPNAPIWTYYCNSKMEWLSIQCGCYPKRCGSYLNNYYNISESGNRLIFPSNFGWDYVMVRCYQDINRKDLMIPYLAKETFMTGLQYFAATNNPNPNMIQYAAILGQKYSRQKWGLSVSLNKYRMAEWRMILSPPTYVPSFYDGRNGRYGNGYNNNNNGYY